MVIRDTIYELNAKILKRGWLLNASANFLMAIPESYYFYSGWESAISKNIHVWESIIAYPLFFSFIFIALGLKQPKNTINAIFIKLYKISLISLSLITLIQFQFATIAYDYFSIYFERMLIMCYLMGILMILAEIPLFFTRKPVPAILKVNSLILVLIGTFLIYQFFYSFWGLLFYGFTEVYNLVILQFYN